MPDPKQPNVPNQPVEPQRTPQENPVPGTPRKEEIQPQG